MKGKIINYRRGRRTEHTNQYIIEMKNVISKEDAIKFLGKKVKWKSRAGKEIYGNISKTHGNNGAVIARMKKGLPGQAIGTEVEIIE